MLVCDVTITDKGLTSTTEEVLIEVSLTKEEANHGAVFVTIYSSLIG